MWHPGANDDDPIAQQIQDAEAKAPEDLTEDDKMVLLGRPKNGDVIRAQLRVKESKEFKVSRIFSLWYFCYIYCQIKKGKEFLKDRYILQEHKNVLWLNFWRKNCDWRSMIF